MLEFIVLGDVPGIHFQLTFTWVLLVMFIASSFLLYLVEKPRLRQLRIKQTENKTQQSAA